MDENVTHNILTVKYCMLLYTMANICANNNAFAYIILKIMSM